MKTGPLAFALPAEQGRTWAEVHEALAFGLLGAIVLHIAGVLLESRRNRENLPLSMITGHKPARPGDRIAPERPARVTLAISTVSLVLLALGATAVNLSERRPAE